jgi:ribonuclease HI
MVTWSVELSEFDIIFEPRGAIKAQVLADFIVEMTAENGNLINASWILSVDGSSNLKGSGAGVTLEGPDSVLIEQSLRFEFKASNNQSEYEALVAGMRLAVEMGVTELEARSDSQLVTGQVTGNFQTKDPQLLKYLEKVAKLIKKFKSFKLCHVPRDQNSRADLLARLASTKRPGNNRSVI